MPPANGSLGSFLAGTALNFAVRGLLSKFVTDARAVDYVAGRMYEDESGPGTWRDVQPALRETWRQRARSAAVVLADVVTPRIG